MAPRMGRPKSENPRTEKILISLTPDDMEKAKEAREKDKNPERTLAAWVARKVSEVVNRLAKK